MTFWESSETTAEGYTFIKNFVRNVEKMLNEELATLKLTSEFQDWKWAFVAIIMPEENYVLNGIDTYYKEIRRKNNKSKTMEFRLRIMYSDLENSTQNQQIKLYFEALRKSFDPTTQKKWKIPKEDIHTIFYAIEKVENNFN